MAVSFRAKHVHLLGVGGTGLSAIARVLLERGALVSGSDLKRSPAAEALARDGAQIFVGHRAEHVTGADLLVTSAAIPDSNVEVQAAKAAGIPVLKRPAFLAQLVAGYQVVAVSGTKGKTTSTAMLASILMEAGRDPTFIVGGIITGMETNARAGEEGGIFVIEADEYERTFLELAPHVAVITNVVHDHPDCYPTFDDLREAFEAFAALIPADGLLVCAWDDPAAREIGERRRSEGLEVRFFGTGEGAEWRVEDLRPNFVGGVDCLVTRRGETLGLLRLRLPGAYNALNALAALAVSDFLGVPFNVAREASTAFRGVGRRFELRGEAGGVTVIDDYAHHPLAIRATLSAARQRFPDQPVWAVWQPHTYSRTKVLLEEFTQAFDMADHVIVLPIYAPPGARDRSAGYTISSAEVVASMRHPDVRCADSLEEAMVWLGTESRSGEVVLTLSAGDGNRVGEWLLCVLGEDNGGGNGTGEGQT
ncbi:MAG TPA: UDP-N-acetylmuramate--L-alanine ligase [Chloroflexi bacterium]|nr:UDP-N-acetylmuramate--L-alanine ligase [Chloroflexota bacterium]